MGLKLVETIEQIWDGTILEGNFLSGGIWYPSANTFATGPIPVTPGTYYTGMGGNRFRTRWENSSNGLISGWDYSNPSPTTPTTTQAPANAVWLYVYYANDSTYRNNFQINEGQTIGGGSGGYAENGSAVFGPYSLANVEVYSDSALSWSVSVPESTSMTLKTAITSDANPPSSYSTAASLTTGSGSVEIPDLEVDEDLSGKYLWIKVEALTSDSEVTPELDTLKYSVLGPDDLKTVTITLAGSDRMKYPQGDVAIGYSRLLGGMAGETDILVEDFSDSFTPTGLTPVFNPINVENIELTAASVTTQLLAIDYSNTKEDENIQITASATCNLIHIDDL